MIAVIIIVAVVAGAIAVITAATRTRPPGRHKLNPPGEEDTFVAELRGQPADRFTPGVVLPHTPQLGEPLKPLPLPPSGPVLFTPAADISDGELAGLKQRLTERLAAGGRHLIVLPPRQPDADDAYDDVKTIVSDPEPEPRHEPLLERYERLIDSRPRQVQELLHHHRNSEEAVQSILQRALTPDLLAKLDADKALANGQVDHG